MEKVTSEYMSDGNNPDAVKGGQFPVLQLDTGARCVGRVGQSFDELRAEAIDRGLVDE